MQKILKKDMLCALALILIGIIILIIPLLFSVNFSSIYFGTMLLYAIINGIEFCLNYKSQDYSSALTAIASLAIAITSLIFNVNTPKNIALSLLFWTMFMSLIKLKKADTYHDEKNKMWLFQIVLLALFVIETQILVFGYYIFISGIFEFMDPFIGYLTKGKKIK